MTTPLDIITDALEKLAVYAPGEPISDADSSRGFQTLSDLIDQWNDDSIQLFQIQQITVNLMPGLQMYFLGQGGSVNVQRPPRILLGPNNSSVTLGSTTTPLSIVSAIEWNAIYNPTLLSPMPSGTPVVAFYDPQFPLGILSFAPTPNVGGTASVNGYYGLSGFPASLTTPNITMAPGQELGLSSNLAMLLHSYFAMGNMTPDLLSQAQQSKTVLTLTNRLSRAMTARNTAPQTPIAPRP